MWRASHLRRFLLCTISTPSIKSQNISSSLLTHSSKSISSHFSNPLFLYPKSLSTSTPPSFEHNNKHLPTTENISKEITQELLKHTNEDSLPLPQRLDLHFSYIQLTPSLYLQVLNQSSEAGRSVLDFHQWVSTRPGFKHDDETFSYIVDYFGRRKDFKVIHDVLVSGKGITGSKTLASCIDRLVRAGRDSQTVAFFERMEKEYGFVRDRDSLKLVVTALCDHGFASHAEKMVKSLANEFFPDEVTCDILVRGWCVDGKLDEAKRLAGEMYRGGFELGVFFKLLRVGEGDEMIDRMKSAGFGDAIDKKAYYGFLKILCGIERIDHAMEIFKKMKSDGCKPGVPTYDLLIGKLGAHGRGERANTLFREAMKKELPVQPIVYKVDPRFAKKPKTKKSEKPKRETLPEKMARKRKTLKKLRLSFVKKPTKMMRRAF
ncbi:hypothetical protein IFM89_008164 [Coptis chinensis]|uniref:Pentatricopeptide repeat-containing protein PNM1, mitochondrial n=1 Tax=Coptis chinensis TaxID=261450 RepID=A0A835IUA4_9MAGN|nr:hypothetical protein IFM89_008164 [Coptis chinensis]